VLGGGGGGGGGGGKGGIRGFAKTKKQDPKEFLKLKNFCGDQEVVKKKKGKNISPNLVEKKCHSQA